MAKPATLDGYSDQYTLDCERVLVTLLRGLGPWKESVYLVGGLTPRYLVAARPPVVPAHAGTLDVNIVIDLQILTDTDAYHTLENNLTRMGFERAENEKQQKLSWRWQARTEHGALMVLELLAVPELEAKIKLLKDAPMVMENGIVRARFSTQKAVAQELHMHEADLSKAIAAQELSTEKIPALLGLFGLKYKDQKECLELAQEPLAAFLPRVALARGRNYVAPPEGKAWNDFCDRLHMSRGPLGPADTRSFELEAKSREEWRRPLGLTRMLVPEQPDPARMHSKNLLVVHEGDAARLYLNVAAALSKPRPLDGRVCLFLFLFQDVVINRERQIIPMVPCPDESRARFPGERVPSDVHTKTMQLPLPLPGGEESFFDIPAGWGSDRTIWAVITDRQLENEIVGEGRREWRLEIESLDLLAARLSDPKRCPPGSYAVWKLRYAVEPALLA